MVCNVKYGAGGRQQGGWGTSHRNTLGWILSFSKEQRQLRLSQLTTQAYIPVLYSYIYTVLGPVLASLTPL